MAETSFRLNTGASIPALGLGQSMNPAVEGVMFLSVLKNTFARNMAVSSRRSQESSFARHLRRLPSHRLRLCLRERR